jgi:adenosylcobinamide kinase / adenosylcobinamide-phosphate guanylyltransferase
LVAIKRIALVRKLTFILGGARSGKSTHAENLARTNPGSVLYVATATAGDEEMAARIAGHRAARPSDWRTLEAPRQVGPSVRQTVPADMIILDCITLLANNVLMDLPEEASLEIVQESINSEIEGILEAYQAMNSWWIIVSNEVGLGLVPPYPLGRVYRDALGRANQKIAAAATEVILMVAGIPMRIKGQ